MPYVTVQIIKCATRTQKAQLVREMRDSLDRILKTKPGHTHVVIQEIAKQAGLLEATGRRLEEGAIPQADE